MSHEVFTDNCHFRIGPEFDQNVEDDNGRVVGRVLSIEWIGNGVRARIKIDDKDFYHRLLYGSARPAVEGP